MKHHLVQVIKLESRDFPWRHMVLSGASTGLPLIVALFFGHAFIGILGALCGYLLCLNDHFGGIIPRIQVITVTFGFLVAGFALGNTFHDWETTFRVIITILIYGVGLFGGEGGELERGVLFSALAILISHSLPKLTGDTKIPLLASGGLGYGAFVLTAVLLNLLAPHVPREHATLRASLVRPFTYGLNRHIHALSYALTSLLSIWLCATLGIERGYWVTITVLLIMRPDRQQSVYKIVQRLAGTALGVAVFTPIALFPHSVTLFVILAIIAAIAIPWSLPRNYLIVSFFVSVMLFSLLEIVAVDHRDLHITVVRLYATLCGCGLALAGTAFSKLCASVHQVAASKSSFR
jgi:hypothetical protein